MFASWNQWMQKGNVVPAATEVSLKAPAQSRFLRKFRLPFPETGNPNHDLT